MCVVVVLGCDVVDLLPRTTAPHTASPTAPPHRAQTAVSAIGVVAQGLVALQATTPAVEADAQLLQDLGPRESAVRCVAVV